MSRRRVCVVTGTRAEYGLLTWLMRALQSDPSVELQIIATGAHLSPAHGMTVDAISADGFAVTDRVPIQLEDDSAAGVTKSLGRATLGFADSLARLAPDIVVLLGDRYEILAAAQSALIAGIPVAHIHGGERTEGAFDDAMRHAITKMSHLHFVATQEFAQRVVQLGEQPRRVFVVGATGLDNIARLQLLDRSAIEVNLGMQLRAPSALVTFHPETLGQATPRDQIETVLAAIDQRFAAIVITGTNADPRASEISTAIVDFAASRPGRVAVVQSLGTQRYLSVMKHVDVVIGNSSSGLLEAPAMGVASIDVGDRQRGRPRAPSVIAAACARDILDQAIATALTPGHRAIAALRSTPYGSPGAAERIATVLCSHPLDGLLIKRFYDLPGGVA
jgi:UDP-hydrolysing UDP-N-acetyl-D-glucosamine 2-epimerase